MPLRERGRVLGSLSGGSTNEDQHWSAHDHVLLMAYSEHVGVALAVARAGEAVEQAFTDSLTGLGNRAPAA